MSEPRGSFDKGVASWPVLCGLHIICVRFHPLLLSVPFLILQEDLALLLYPSVLQKGQQPIELSGIRKKGPSLKKVHIESSLTFFVAKLLNFQVITAFWKELRKVLNVFDLFVPARS